MQEAWKTIYEGFKMVAETFRYVWCSLGEAIEYHEKEEKFRQSWHVPESITLSHQVLSRKPLISNIRNSI